MAAARRAGDRPAQGTGRVTGDGAHDTGGGTAAGALSGAVAGLIRQVIEAAGPDPRRARRVVRVPSAQMPAPGLPLVVVISSAEVAVYVRADVHDSVIRDLTAALDCETPPAPPDCRAAGQPG